MAMNSLPTAGVTMRTACGITTRAMMRRCVMPSAGGGLALAAWHGLDAGPEDLRHVGAVVEAQREDAQPDEVDGGRSGPDRRQRQPDEDDLDDERRAPHERDVERRQRVDRRHRRDAAHGTQQGEDDGQEDGRDRDEDRDGNAAQDEPPPRLQPRQVDGLAGHQEGHQAADDERPRWPRR